MNLIPVLGCEMAPGMMEQSPPGLCPHGCDRMRKRKGFSACRVQGAAWLHCTFAPINTSQAVPEGNFPGFEAALTSLLSAWPAGKGLGQEGALWVANSASCDPADPRRDNCYWRGFIQPTVNGVYFPASSL